MKKIITLLIILTFISFKCTGMEAVFKAIGNTVNNTSSLTNEFNVRTSLGLERKDEVALNCAGSTLTLLASLCAISYGCSNLFKKDSSKIGAFISFATGIFGVGYSLHGLHVHSQAYKPYLK